MIVPSKIKSKNINKKILKHQYQLPVNLSKFSLAKFPKIIGTLVWDGFDPTTNQKEMLRWKSLDDTKLLVFRIVALFKN